MEAKKLLFCMCYEHYLQPWKAISNGWNIVGAAQKILILILSPFFLLFFIPLKILCHSCPFSLPVGRHINKFPSSRFQRAKNGVRSEVMPLKPTVWLSCICSVTKMSMR